MVPCLGLGENQEDAPLVGGGGQRKTISVLKSSMYNSLSPYVPLGMKRKGEGEPFLSPEAQLASPIRVVVLCSWVSIGNGVNASTVKDLLLVAI